jgi:hypothetical protein
MSQYEFVMLNKLILRGDTIGGLRPPKVLKNVTLQCLPTMVYIQAPSDSGLKTYTMKGMGETKDDTASKLCTKKLQLNRGKRNQLKGEKAIKSS